MIFLYNEDKGYTYDELLREISKSEVYYPFYKTSDLFSFFANFVKSLAAGKDLTLLDADLNPSEIDGLDEHQVNVPSPLQKKSYATMEEVVDAVKKSESNITIFTSGTTGQPKKVEHTVASLTRSVRTGDKYVGQVWGYAYNPTHMAGLQVFFQAFENLNTLVNIFGASRAKVYESIKSRGITHISATPTFYRLLLPFEDSYDSVVRITLGGEKSEKSLYEAINKIFPNARINNVYASTEAGTLFAARGDAFQIPENLRDKFRVVDNELLIHKSLLGSSESFSFNGDFYHSGDLITWVDKDKGLFKFVSRKNELINVGGYKVNPEEVEDVLMKLPGVKQALVYGKANSVLGNVLCADIVLQEGVELTELDVKKALSAQLQDFKIPRRIKFVESMQLTRTGKLKR